VKIKNSKFIQQTRRQGYKALLVAIGLGTGVLVAAQWHSMPTRVTNPLEPYLDLKDTKELLLVEQGQLKTEIGNNNNDISKYQNSLRANENSKDKLSSLDNQKARAGLTKLTGPGIVVLLDDSPTGTATDDSIVHAPDLRDVVNLLWGAGGEAIEINGERIVANTSIDCIVNTILVNNTHLAAPYRVTAIGDQKLMAATMLNQQNLIDLYKRKAGSGLIFQISTAENLSVQAFSGSFNQKSGSN
jgi:uncharacterized protein YlxW (UPF0749 family)